MAIASGKTCRVCQKDVTNAKRVKDAKGNYYCADCHGKLVKEPGAGGAAAGGGKRTSEKHAVKKAGGNRSAAAVADGEMDLAPVRDAVVAEVKPAAKKAVAKSSGDELELAPIIESKTPERPKVQVIVEVEEEKPKGKFGGVVKVLVILVVLGVLGAVGWYVKGMYFS